MTNKEENPPLEKHAQGFAYSKCCESRAVTAGSKRAGSTCWYVCSYCRNPCDIKFKMILPQIHLNGTSRHMLLRDYEAVDIALDELLQQWQSVEFNARDYYTQGENAWEQAIEERRIHQQNLKELQKYITIILIHLSNE